MRTSHTAVYKLAIAASLALLALFFSLMLTYLPAQLQQLATAQGDVSQWSISQVDTEFANLDALLSARIGGEDVSDDEIRLRVDIALSRLGIVTTGTAGRMLQGRPEIETSMALISGAADRLTAIVDKPGPLAPGDLQGLREITRDVRPEARRIALIGVELGAARTEQSRDAGLRALTITGTVAGVLLLVLAALVLLLNALLARATQRDADLVRSSRRLAATVEASMDAIVTTDALGRVIAFNVAAEQVFGWPRGDVLGHLLRDRLLPAGAHHAAGAIPELLALVRRAPDLSALRRTGETFPVELKVTQVEGRDGTEYIFYFRDISARRIAEQSLIDARDRAERTDTAKSRFVAVMSHEMRTPLNGILGVLDLLAKTPLTETQARYAGIASASSEILLEQVNEALDITRIETGSLLLGSKPFEVVPLVDGVVAALTPLATEKGLSLSATYQPGLPSAFDGDGGRIRQIVTNLVGNAIKFTETGKVTASVSGVHGPVQTALEITVCDTGPGIPKAEQERIFEDFVALSQAKPAGKGRQRRGDGLGLSISRRIARQMGGDLLVRSAAGKGTCFVLTVPLARVAAPLVAPQPDPGRSILLVEDNDINRGILRDMLRGLGHRVSEASNGADAVQAATSDLFDLILMDINMPRMGGIAATRALRSGSGPNVRTPIVALTAHGEDEFRERARDAGMDGFETKPIRLPTLLRILSRMPARAATGTPDGLVDLCKALGIDRVEQIAAEFFDQLDAVGPLLQGGAKPLAAAVHKAKGAAALLGLKGIEAMLASIETAAIRGETGATGLTRFRATSDAGRAQITAALASLRAAGTGARPVRPTPA